ncbi:MAG: hypothetical protein COX44_00680 [Candidatus Portnoybacteria bacterium CG23_combo_of_CG06-09_8_20_14_all_37_13]|uniref:Cytotoxin n=1 Tax=Candidatus Portnoybacteria bacterium CG23_combo_of_CG06-09_8_20_14_all_37_13 TaxID=1974819 RepID=A0A2G9YDG9_9BACT|nr:MAG: hypothetical protein COX44_00680 [Candidatus Portnoybacteria bacterium CG23_combo_of_CG06-09_8_20_14_all_37_13]
MELFFTKCFRKDYKRLPANIQNRTDKKLDFLLRDIRHPSLRIKKVKRYKELFESSITMQYRCLFSIKNNICTLHRIGKHDEILK